MPGKITNRLLQGFVRKTIVLSRVVADQNLPHAAPQVFDRETKRLFLITSVINPKLSALSYSSRRSIYDNETRLTQTVETIRSINKYCGGAQIVLAEGSALTMEQRGVLELYPITLLDLREEPEIAAAVDGPHKGVGEAALLLAAFSKIAVQENFIYFKISGRYLLDENFSVSHFPKNRITVKKTGSEVISTRLYGFGGVHSQRVLAGYRTSLWACRTGLSIEEVLWRCLPQRSLNVISKLGVSGNIAPDGAVIKE